MQWSVWEDWENNGAPNDDENSIREKGPAQIWDMFVGYEKCSLPLLWRGLDKDEQSSRGEYEETKI